MYLRVTYKSSKPRRAIMRIFVCLDSTHENNQNQIDCKISPFLRKGVRESEEKRAFCDWRVVLNSPTWPCPRAACRIRLSLWGGAPPHVQASGGGIYVVRHSSHSVEDTNLQILYACLVTNDAKA